MKFKDLQVGDKFTFLLNKMKYVKITDEDKNGYCIIANDKPYASPFSAYGGDDEGGGGR